MTNKDMINTILNKIPQGGSIAVSRGDLKNFHGEVLTWNTTRMNISKYSEETGIIFKTKLSKDKQEMHIIRV